MKKEREKMKNTIKIKKMVCPVCGKDMTVKRVFSRVDVSRVKGLEDIFELAKKEDEDVKNVDVFYKCPCCGLKANMELELEYEDVCTEDISADEEADETRISVYENMWETLKNELMNEFGGSDVKYREILDDMMRIETNQRGCTRYYHYCPDEEEN